MKQPKTEPSDLTFDVAELLAHVENDHELLRDILRIFREEFPRQLHSLGEAVNSGDGKRVAFAAHTLKGMLSNLAAARMAAAAGLLEQMGRNGEKAGLQEAFAAFERDAAKLLSQLGACMTEVKG